MKIKLLRSYRSKNGNPTFVYTVHGTADELDVYKDAQGDYYREDTISGEPLWFTTRCVGTVGKLIITTNGNIVPDMSAFDQASSIAAQYGGNFGQELAKMSAASILGIDALPSTSAEPPVAQEVPSEEQADDPADV